MEKDSKTKADPWQLVDGRLWQSPPYQTRDSCKVEFQAPIDKLMKVTHAHPNKMNIRRFAQILGKSAGVHPQNSCDLMITRLKHLLTKMPWPRKTAIMTFE